MLKPKDAKQFIKKIELAKATLAKTRDDLVELKDEIDMLIDNGDEELADLDSVIESLSRFV